MKAVGYLRLLLCFFSVALGAYAEPGGKSPISPFNTDPIMKMQVDKTKPVPRGYIVPRVISGDGQGARIEVELFFDRLNSPTTLWLQTVVNNGKGSMLTIPLKLLSDHVSDNPALFYSKREFKIDYAEVNQVLHKYFPAAPELEVGPGSPLFVYAQFFILQPANPKMPNLLVTNYHQWGGVARGGIVFMPGKPPKPVDLGAKSVVRLTALDVGYPISESLALPYNSPDGKSGLKIGGQIKSRVEGEGKFQVPLDQYDDIRAKLFKIAEDPAEAARLFGPEWKVTKMDRYYERLPDGSLRLDAKGFPIPDPMVDTYYDNDLHQAAENDIAIRDRWTEGNATRSWNFKPGIGTSDPNGIVYRNEYGLDATDDKPESISKFADSDHPLNMFNSLKDLPGNPKPSEFLKPSVRVTDHRYKFKFQHTNGLIIEVSLDNVDAEDLRNPKNPGVHFVQMEMDIDHLATQSQNVVSGRMSVVGGGGLLGLLHMNDAQIAAVANTVDNSAFLDGRPTLHLIEDTEANSPLRMVHANDFALSGAMVESLTKHTLGEHWLPAPQKYALAAHALGVVAKESGSVARMKNLEAQFLGTQKWLHPCQIILKKPIPAPLAQNP